MRPKRLLFVTTGLTGGAEMMVCKLLSRLDCETFNPIVVSLVDKGTLGPLIEALGVPVYAVGMRVGLPSPGSVYRLYERTCNWHVDLIQGWMCLIRGRCS